MIWAKYRRPLLLLVYVLFFLHAALWHHFGYTGVGHLGFGEFFGTMRSGVVTAGTVFSILVFFHALFFGGLFCGWFCHWGITQDVASWIMRKCGIKPAMAQLDSKLIPWFWFLVIIAQVVLYWIFTGFPTSLSFNASATPVWSGVPRSILLICMTTIVSGFILVFLFGERAFCRSICTFRLWFSWFERFAPHKVRQIKECTSCQLECTSVCPMGVDVAQEVNKLGHVKNTECVKCHVCIGACPNGALETSFTKNNFHKEGPAVTQPATFSNSVSLLQLCMAIIVLIVFGFNIGGNMSLSLGFLTGFLLVRVWSVRSVSTFELLTAALIFIGLYFKIDMNDPISLGKGLTAIAFFLLIARFARYDQGFTFIRNQAREYTAPKTMLAVAVIVAGLLGGSEIHTSIMIHKANAALKNKDLQGYTSIMEGCAAGHSDPAGAYYDLGKTQIMINQPDKALESFKKSIELIFKIEAIDTMLSHLFEAGAADQWMNLVNYLAEKHPDVEKFQVYKANGLAEAGKNQEAEELLQKISAANPNNHDALISLGVIRMEQSRINDASELFSKAYKIAPASSAYYLANTFQALKKHSEAESYFAEAIAGNPQNIIFRVEQGNNFVAQNKYREAITAWRGAVELDPELTDVTNNINNAEKILAERKAAILGKPAETTNK